MNFYLPSKIPGYLLRLSHHYGITSKTELKQLIDAARVFVIEGASADNWNGGTYGHDVRFYLPLEVLAPIGGREQTKLTEALKTDLSGIASSVENEFVSNIHFELDDESDPDFQRAQPVNKRAVVPPDSLKIWKPGLIRLFVSHRDGQKVEAAQLAVALEAYGFTCFVAHDTITPMKEWRLEIMRGLETMEAMLVFLTDDFESSSWTNQEVGYALGANKPVVCLKLGRKDPPGFISHIQALKAKIDTPIEAAAKLFPLLGDALGASGRLQAGLVKAFAESPDWGETTQRFKRLDDAAGELTDEELALIISAYNRNDQLHAATYLTNKGHYRLKAFLKKATGKDFNILGKQITEVKDDDFDNVPF